MGYRVRSAPLFSETVDALPIEPDRQELLRYLGYPSRAAESRRVPEAMERALSDGLSHLLPQAMYRAYAIEAADSTSLTIGGVAIRGQVARFLGGSDRVIVFVVTVGSRISELARAAQSQGDIVLAWAFDALGSWAAEAAAHALSQRLENRLSPSEALTPRYSPGYCGMKLTEQTSLFELLDAQSIGVELMPSMLMQPEKSVSGLVGLGEKSAIISTGFPCDRCTDTQCTMRRQASGARGG